MKFSNPYIQEREEAMRSGMAQVLQLGMQEVMLLGVRQERRTTIENLLQVRFQRCSGLAGKV